MIRKILRTDPIPSTPLLLRTAPSPRRNIQIKDTLESPLEHKKPHLLKRAAMSFGLLLVHSFTWGYRALCWIGDAISGPCKQKKIYKQLKQVAKTGDPAEIKKFLQSNSHHPHIAGFLMKELLVMPELHEHLTEILDGANVRLYGDEGFFCTLWRMHPKAHPRISSHNYQGNHCYELQHLSFWIDLEGNTRFQFQSSPLKGGLRNFIEHTLSFLRYKRDNKQRGVTGSSPYTEQNCITLAVDPEYYTKEKQKII